VGFIATIVYIFAPFLGGLIALASFSNWITAIFFTAGLATLSGLAARFHDRHQRSGAFDDKLTGEKMAEAEEYLVKKWEDEDAEGSRHELPDH
jgi:hypothetical protein